MINTQLIKSEAHEWTDKQGNPRYYISRWSKSVPGVKLDFQDNQIVGASFNGNAMTVDEFKAIKVWYDSGWELHVKCDDGELEEAIKVSLTRKYDPENSNGAIESFAQRPSFNKDAVFLLIDDTLAHVAEPETVSFNLNKIKEMLDKE